MVLKAKKELLKRKNHIGIIKTMKLKFILIPLLIVTSLTFGQNSTLAKSYYIKAKTELDSDKYVKALEYIEKSKEYAGQTNPDIIYIELKARYEMDININKTKELCTTFLNEAFEDDERTEEVSNLLVNILESDNYYDNGNIKSREFSHGGIKYVSYFNENGLRYKSYQLLSKNNKVFYFTYHNEGKSRISLSMRKEGFLVSVRDKENDIKTLQLYTIRKENFSTVTNLNCFVDRSYKTKNDETYFSRNEIGKIISFHPLSQEVQNNMTKDLPKINVGIIKELEYTNNDGTKDYYIFSEQGIPLSWKVNKNGRMQKSYSYNINSKNWTEN